MIKKDDKNKVIIEDKNWYLLTFYLLFYYSFLIFISFAIVWAMGIYGFSSVLFFVIVVYVSIPILILYVIRIKRVRILISDSTIELLKRPYSGQFVQCFEVKWKEFDEISVTKEKTIKPSTPGIHSGSYTSETFILYTFEFKGPDFNKTLKLGNYIFRLAINEQLLKVLKEFSEKKHKILIINDNIIDSINYGDHLAKIKAIERQVKAVSKSDEALWKRSCMSLIVLLIEIISTTIFVLLLNYYALPSTIISGALFSLIIFGIMILFIVLIIYLESTSNKEEEIK